MVNCLELIRRLFCQPHLTWTLHLLVPSKKALSIKMLRISMYLLRSLRQKRRRYILSPQTNFSFFLDHVRYPSATWHQFQIGWVKSSLFGCLAIYMHSFCDSINSFPLQSAYKRKCQSFRTGRRCTAAFISYEINFPQH